MVDISALLQFLFEGDYFGFIQAVYVSAFQNVDLFYGMVTLILVAPLYIRTRSLLLVSIIWIMLGGLFITAMPIVSTLAVLLMVFGLAVVLYEVFMTAKR